MDALVIIELEVAGKTHPRLARCGVLVEIDFLVFDRAPQAFGKDIIQGAAPPIHADAHACRFHEPDVLRTGKVAALVAIQNLRRGLRQCLLHRPCHKGLRQGLIELPTHDIARIPVQHRDQIEPTLAQANIGDVDAPNVVRTGGGDITQQVRIDRLLVCPLTQVGAGRNCMSSHFTHMPRHRFMVDPLPVPPELGRDAPDPVERPARVDHVNLMLERHLSRDGATGW